MAHKLRVIGRTHGTEWRDERLLGKTFLDRQREVVLRIGSNTWTRDELVTQVKCANINAARLLSKAAARLDVENAQHMAAHVSLDELFAQEHVGITTVYVWLCVLDAMNQNPLAWIDRPADEIVTLTTEKLRMKKAQIELAQQQKREPRRPARAQRRAG